MKFSVIIPLYNKAPYVAKAIDSVLTQTFTDYELLIVDDGSQDGSYEIAGRAIEGRPNCRLLRQENAGVSVARNNGISSSQGDFLCFLDADDWWAQTFLEEMDKLVAEFPDAGIYGTNYIIVSEHNHKTREALIGVDDGFECGYIDYCSAYNKTTYMPLWTGAVCINRSVIEEVGGFNPQLKMGEDFDLWIRIAIGHKVAFLNKPLSHYNQDVNSATRAIGSLPDPSTQFAFCAEYLEDVKKHNQLFKYTIEMVQIICLRSYYLSSEYHDRAKKVLSTLDIDAHKGRYYTDYLRLPTVWLRLKRIITQLKSQWKQGLAM